jgi:diacylglycerol O-acyltransferase
LPDRQFAIYMKLNHSIIDGASAAHRIASSLGTSPRDRIKPPPFAVTTAPRKPRPSRPLAERLARMGTTATRQAAALKDVSLSALRKSLSELGGADPGGSRAFTARHSPMNEPLPVARSLATLSLPLDEMREVGRNYGATLNDVVVAVTDEGVHRYLRATGRTFPHRLVASCPMSMREEGDTEAATKASAMFVHLGRHDATITDRIGQVVAAMGTAKQELRSMSRDAAMLYVIAVVGLAGARESTGAARVTPPLANLVISNVPGPRETMYLNGARLVATHAVPGIYPGIGLNVTVSSYANLMNFGFGGNGVTMHSLPEMARHVAAQPGRRARRGATDRPAEERSHGANERHRRADDLRRPRRGLQPHDQDLDYRSGGGPRGLVLEEIQGGVEHAGRADPTTPPAVPESAVRAEPSGVGGRPGLRPRLPPAPRRVPAARLGMRAAQRGM